MPTLMTSSQFVSTLGVNVHVEYTDGKYANAANVISDLAYLGESHVRDAVLNPANQGQASYDALARAGIKFDFFLQGTSLTQSLGLVDAFLQRHPGSVSTLEGPNEVNNFPISYAGLSGNAAATAYQAALDTAVKADTALTGVPVVDLTSWPFLAGPSDDANYHFYPSQGEQPAAAYGSTFFPALAAQEPGKPVVMTEGGYNTLLTDTNFGGVDQATQAKLLLNLYCDDAKAGVATTYIYQLLDAYTDTSGTNSDDHFGLFNLDNSPKLAATAIHNLTTVLAAGADASATAGALAFESSGAPAMGGLLDLTKNALTHDLLIWSEPTIWNGVTKTEVTATGSPTTLHFDALENVSVFDPMVGASPIATYTGVHDVSVTVADHPLIIEVTTDVADQVTALYEENIGRDPTSSELSVWQGLIQSGVTMGQLRSTLIQTVQGGAFLNAEISGLYETFAGRAATASELQVWRALVQGGAGVNDAQAALVDSPQGTAYTNSEVTSLYQSLAGRAASSAELGVWHSLLSSGVSVSQLTDTLERAVGNNGLVSTLHSASTSGVTYSQGMGVTTLSGFDPTSGVVHLSGAEFSGVNVLDQAHAQQISVMGGGTDVLLTFSPTDSLLIENVSLVGLHASNFGAG